MEGHSTHPMRICLIGPAYPLRGGIAHYNAQLGIELSARHEITLVSFSRQYPALLFPGRTQFESVPRRLALKVEPLIDSINPITWIRTANRIAGLSPDLLIVHWWNPFFAPCIGTTVRFAKRRSRATVVFICHNVLPHEPFLGTGALTRLALAAGDAFLLHSEADCQQLTALRPGARTVVLPQPPGRGFGDPLGKEQARARLGVKGSVLLFFGLIRKYKGLHGLIEALPRVLQALDCTLLVVGEFYEEKARCLDLIRSLGLASNVRIVDRFIPDEEVSLYFSAADVVVLPYESATQSAIIPIAYAFERPVVATRVGGLPEAVRDDETGYLVDPRDPEALARAIIRFYKEGKGMPFEQNIRRLEAGRSWEELAAAIESFAR